MQDFSRGGGPNFKISGILDIHMSRAAKLRAFARGVWGHAPPKKIFKNGAISCVLRAILTTFMVKNPLKKLEINLNFFTDPFIMLLPH